AAVLTAARPAIADLVNADPRGVVLGADRAQLLTALAEASSSRVGLGYEVVVTRLDDEANIAPWLRAANRYGAKVKWAEVDIETGELPAWQWEGLIDKPTRLVAIASASSTLGTITDLGEVTKLTHEVGGMVVVDHSAAAPYRLIDINEIDADVVALNAVPWGGPPIGALVF
nr:aminotransferase class V-fold PLP-dependent enzyme [Streptomyces sp. DSM 41633]